ncbi:hypothetical protein AABD42_09225 [Staphylococcus shinii]|uniref:hypothetical protein n=1 Tax=Staphylococcus shinii TaxID=2912228 RepID=UPI001AAFA4F8|nr:hypothetical protein [Staphylococcus shinii]MBO3066064.1 hypothetical protein [Staphylococcus shinii]
MKKNIIDILAKSTQYTDVFIYKQSKCFYEDYNEYDIDFNIQILFISFIQLMKTHENSNDIYVYRPNNDIGVMFNTNNDNVTDVHIGYGGAGG